MERQPIEVFFSYSREDKPLRDKLEIHLSSLRQQGVISSWHDRQIVAGSEWKEEIDRHMRTADIILLLVSPDFVNSKYCYDIELPYAVQRHEAGEAYVVPILLRPVARWKNLPFAKLQVYPSGGVPITQWADPDNGFVDVAEGIAIAVEQLVKKRWEQEQSRSDQLRLEQKEQARQEPLARQEKERARLRAEREQKEQARQERQVQLEEARNRNVILQSSQRDRRSDTNLLNSASIPALTRSNRSILIGAGIAIAIVLGGGLTIASFKEFQPQAEPSATATASSSSVSAEDFFNRGSEKQKNRDYQGAIVDYDQVIKLNPDDADAFINRGVARYDLGDKQAAIADYDQAIKLNPDDADAFINRGVARYDLGDKQAAIADYDQAIKLNPDDADIFYNRGFVRYDLGDKQAAIADYDQAIKLKPDYANAFYNRGLARKALVDKQAAIADFQKAADLYQKQGKPDDYQDALNRLKELQP